MLSTCIGLIDTIWEKVVKEKSSKGLWRGLRVRLGL